MTILESMAFNVPVITTDVFGIPEIVRNNREALFVKPGSPLQIKEKIEYLIENPTEAAEIARNARNRLVVKFDYTRFISDYQRCMVQAYFESSNTFINI